MKRHVYQIRIVTEGEEDLLYQPLANKTQAERKFDSTVQSYMTKGYSVVLESEGMEAAALACFFGGTACCMSVLRKMSSRATSLVRVTLIRWEVKE
jgi:hypothetical protein